MRRLLLRTLLVVVLLELGLQLVDRLRYQSQLISLDKAPIAGQVMFVGDDFVFDSAARSRDQAWPVEACRDLGVARNLGRQGIESDDLLRLLPAWLDIHRPEVVYLGLGASDLRRRQASLVSVAEIPGRSLPYQMRFQLGRLIGGWLSGDDGMAEARGFVGVWHFGTDEVEFFADGTMRINEQPASWQVEAGGMRVTLPGAEPSPVGWKLDEGRLQLSGALLQGSVDLEPGPAMATPADRARLSLRGGRLDEARWINEVALRSADAEAEDHVVAVEIAAAEGSWQRVAAELEVLRQRAATSPAERLTLARALLAAGEEGEVIALAKADPAKLAAVDPELCLRIGRAVAGTAGAEVFVKAMAAPSDVPPAVGRSLAFACAESLRKIDPDAALRFAIRGLRPGGTAIPFEPELAPGILRDVEQQRLTDLIGDPELEAQVFRWRDQQRAKDEAALATLRHNLELALRVAQGYATRVVVLDPEDDERLSQLRREAAGRLGASYLSAPLASLPAAVRVDLQTRESGR